MGVTQLQCVVIYGLAQSGMDRANTNLIREALTAVDSYPLPFVIMGDFNCNRGAILAEEFEARQMADLRTLHLQLTGQPMPPTCKGVTTPDMAICSPEVANWVSQVHVCPPGDFDTHQVVTFRLQIPADVQYAQCLQLPRTWVELNIDSQYIPEAYEHANHVLGSPQDLREWGATVECAIDCAHRQTQLALGTHPLAVQPLSKAYRGRCCPGKPRQIQRALLTKVARPGDFSSGDEIARYATLHKVKQVRRVQALYNRMKVVLSQLGFDKWHELHLEWNAILRARAFGGNFVQWCQRQPELGPPAMFLPTIDYLHTLLDLLKHETQHDLAVDKQIHRDRANYIKHLDRKLGGSRKAFASIKEPAMPPLHEVVTDVIEDAILVPKDDGTLIAYCDNPHQFSVACPVEVNQISCRIMSVDDFSLTLRPTQNMPATDESCQVLQHKIHTDPREILALLTQYWLPYWNSHGDRPGTHEAFAALLRSLPQQIPGPALRLNDDELWTQAIASLKVPSARGVDGISSLELQQLPPAAIRHLKSLLLAQSHGFAADYMLAITVPIPKTPDVPTPGQVRPITILPQIYRLWAKVCTRQLLTHLAQHLPPDITGFLRGRGPTEAFLRQQIHIEISHWTQSHAAGMSIDLLKCFNTIAPWAVKMTFEWLGFPAQIVEQWSHSLRNLIRVWKLGHECTSPINTNHGMPEGDSWSVVSILSLAYVWVLAIKQEAPSCFLSAYADNWSWAATAPAEHEHILQCTTDLAHMTHMVVDWKKSWTWATSLSMHNMLLQVLATKPYVAELHRKLRAMDLGAMMTYQGAPQLGKFRQRLERAHQRLQRLERHQLPHHTKALLVKNSVVPLAFYGSEVIPLGETHVGKLRSAISNAMLGHSQSRNAALAILAMPKLQDPMLELVIRSIRAMKKMYNLMTPAEQAAFRRVASRHTGIAAQCKGPLGCMVYYLSKLGWTYHADGRIQVDANICLPLHSTNTAVFAKWALYTWGQDVMLHHSDRKQLRLLRLNPSDTRQVIAKFSETAQRQLAQDISLSYQTESQKSKWAEDATGECQYCGDTDSRHHRIYECPAAADIRQRFRDTIDWMQLTGSEFHELPFLLQHENQQLLEHLHFCQPEAMISQQMSDILANLPPEYIPTFYTDGALIHPHSATCRYGAYAIVMDTCMNTEQRVAEVQIWRQTGTFPASLCRFASARVTGNQTIYRAELFAVVCICEWTQNTCVKTDNASVVSTFNQCLDAVVFSQLGHRTESDLVYRLWTALRTGRRSICKVKAHQEVTIQHTALEIYDILGNALADEVAGQTATRLYPQITRLADDMFTDTNQAQTYLASFYEMLLELRTHYAKLQRNSHEGLLHDMLHRSSGPSPQQRLASWTVDDPWVAPQPGVTMFQYSPWGLEVCKLVQEWMLLVKWRKQEEPIPQDPGVSWMELWVSFTLWSQFLLPQKRPLPNGDAYLQAFPDWTTVQVYNLQMGEVANTFANLVLQIRKLTTHDVWPVRAKGFCKSVYLLGGRHQPYGFLQRPEMPEQAQVAEYMQKFVTQSTDTDALPSMSGIQLRLLEGMTLTRCWSQALKHVAKGYAEMRKWRKQPQRPLSFA